MLKAKAQNTQGAASTGKGTMRPGILHAALLTVGLDGGSKIECYLYGYGDPPQIIRPTAYGGRIMLPEYLQYVLMGIGPKR